MKKRQLAVILTMIIILILGISISVLLNNNSDEFTPIHYTFTILNVFPHDVNAFTQGLVFENGTLYESTGLYNYSSLRYVELETGKVLRLYSLPSQLR